MSSYSKSRPPSRPQSSRTLHRLQPRGHAGVVRPNPTVAELPARADLGVGKVGRRGRRRPHGVPDQHFAVAAVPSGQVRRLEHRRLAPAQVHDRHDKACGRRLLHLPGLKEPPERRLQRLISVLRAQQPRRIETRLGEQAVGQPPRGRCLYPPGALALENPPTLVLIKVADAGCRLTQRERGGDDAARRGAGDQVEVPAERLTAKLLLQRRKEGGGVRPHDPAAVEAEDSELVLVHVTFHLDRPA